MTKTKISLDYIENRLSELDALNNEKYEPLSFLTLAELYYDVFEDFLCFNSDLGCPMEFDGTKWQICKNLSVYTTLFTKALIKYTAGYRNPLSEFAFSLTKPSKARQLEAQFKTLLESNVTLDDFDNNPYLLNTLNGVYNLKTGELLEASAEFKFLKSVDAEYDDSFTGSNRWAQFVLEVMNFDKKKASFLQRVLGYCLLGTKNEDKFFIFHGATTRNGKSTLMSAVLNVLKDYGVNAQHETFCETYACRNPAGPSSDIARLAGARLCHVPEPKKSMTLDIAKIKQLTGSDAVTARFLNKNEFSYTPQFGLIFTTNHLPRINDATIFKSNRVIVIPFDRHFTPEEQDPTLRELFNKKEYKNIILKWLIDGARAYLKNGLNDLPESVRVATETYAQQSDSVTCFLNEKLTVEPGSEIPANTLYSAYETWCENLKLTPDGKHNFLNIIRDRYEVLPAKKIGTTTYSNVITGVKLD